MSKPIDKVFAPGGEALMRIQLACMLQVIEENKDLQNRSITPLLLTHSPSSTPLPPVPVVARLRSDTAHVPVYQYTHHHLIDDDDISTAMLFQ